MVHLLCNYLVLLRQIAETGDIVLFRTLLTLTPTPTLTPQT